MTIRLEYNNTLLPYPILLFVYFATSFALMELAFILYEVVMKSKKRMAWGCSTGQN